MDQSMQIGSALKKCTKCGTEKPVYEYGKHTMGKGGLNPSCKSCCNKRTKEWAEANRHRKRAASLEWNKNNPEKVIASKRKYLASDHGKAKEREYGKNYRAKNSQKTVEYMKIYRQQPKAKAYMARYRKDNLVQHRANENKRRARKANAGGSHSAKDVEMLMELQRSMCVYCKKDIRKSFHVDHIYPISSGGSNDKENIQLLCPLCNMRKHKADPIAFAQSQGALL